MSVRLAIVVSHPIQHFAPWHREVARLNGIDLKVFFCCDWGTEAYFDSEFESNFKWDIPLLDGYEYEFLPLVSRPTQLNYRQVDNPGVATALDRFAPDVVKVFSVAGGWSALQFLVEPDPNLAKPPIEALSEGRVGDVVNAAKAYLDAVED